MRGRNESFLAIRRTDGELIYGEFAWLEAPGFAGDPWRGWDDMRDDEDEPVEYELVRMIVKPIERRTYPAIDAEGGQG